VLYKHAGCCLFLHRFEDAATSSQAVLEAAGWALEREGGWGRDVFGAPEEG
jgi:hypothetical protein